MTPDVCLAGEAVTLYYRGARASDYTAGAEPMTVQ